MTDDVVDDDPGVGSIVNRDTHRSSQQLPLAIDIINEVYEGNVAGPLVGPNGITV